MDMDAGLAPFQRWWSKKMSSRVSISGMQKRRPIRPAMEQVVQEVLS